MGQRIKSNLITLDTQRLHQAGERRHRLKNMNHRMHKMHRELKTGDPAFSSAPFVAHRFRSRKGWLIALLKVDQEK